MKYGKIIFKKYENDNLDIIFKINIKLKFNI